MLRLRSVPFHALVRGEVIAVEAVSNRVTLRLLLPTGLTNSGLAALNALLLGAKIET